MGIERALEFLIEIGRGWLIRASSFGAARASCPRYIKFMHALMRNDTNEI
jgi:hypothetical protein